jgi:tetratricopeptide (TPR) repeat protein
MFELAVRSFRLALGEENQKLALALGKLGCCQSYCDNLVVGSNNAILGLEIARKCGDPDTLATCLCEAARSFNVKGMIAAAGEPLLREAVEIRRRLTNDPVALAGCLSAWGLATEPNNEAAIREALKIYEQQLGPDHKSVGGELFVLGQVLREQKRFADAEPVLRKATERIGAVWDANDPYQPLVKIFFAQTLLDNGKPKEAEAVLLKGMEQGLPEYHLRAYLNTLSAALAKQGRGDELESVFSQTLGTDPSKSDHFAQLGNLRAFRGKWSAATECFSNAVALGPENEMLQFNLAIALLKSGRKAEYEECCRTFLKFAESRREHFGIVDKAATVSLLLPVTGADFQSACHLAEAAQIFEKRSDAEERVFLLQALLEYRRGRMNAARDWAERTIAAREAAPQCRAAAAFLLALAQAHLSQAEHARAAFVRGRQLVDELSRWSPLWSEWVVAEHLRDEAASLLGVRSSAAEEKNLAEAERAARQRIERLRERLPPNDPQLDGPLVTLTQILIDARRFPEAEEVARESLANREKNQPDKWFTSNTRSVLGDILVEQKKYAEAEPLLRSGYEGLKQRQEVLPGAGKVCLSNSLDRLVRLYEAWGKPEQAAEWRAKLPPETTAKND